MDDFRNGIGIDMQLSVPIGFFHATRDDWDITVLKLKLTFVSQKGTKQLQELDVPNFRLSSDNNLSFYFDGNFHLIQ
jgi:hypothetical protein